MQTYNKLYFGICCKSLALAFGTTFALNMVRALLLFLWSCLINYSIWAKQKWETTIKLQLDKFFLLSRSVLRPLSTRASCSYDASKEVKNLPAAIPVQP